MGMLSIGATPIFLKGVSESLYMELCQIILTWTVVLPCALIIVVYASKLFTIIEKHLPLVLSLVIRLVWMRLLVL